MHGSLRTASLHTENKSNHLAKNKVDIESPKMFIKYDKLMLKTQQKFKSERYKAVPLEINNISLMWW